MLIVAWLILIIPFFVFAVAGIREYFITKHILILMKDIDYEKWVYLTSFSLPGIKYLLWMNPFRFRKFVKGGNYLNNARLQDYIRLYRKNQTIAMICWIILMVEIISLSILGLLLKN